MNTEERIKEALKIMEAKTKIAKRYWIELLAELEKVEVLLVRSGFVIDRRYPYAVYNGKSRFTCSIEVRSDCVYEVRVFYSDKASVPISYCNTVEDVVGSLSTFIKRVEQPILTITQQS